MLSSWFRVFVDTVIFDYDPSLGRPFAAPLIVPTKLVPLSDLIRWMLSRLPIYLLNESVKESVSNDCEKSV